MSNVTVSSSTRKILLVEDEIYLLEFLSYFLASKGYNVITAADGQEAVEIYKNQINDIDLVLMDIMMPIKDGITAHNEIKDINSDARILLMSGYSAVSLGEIAPSGIIQKPMQPEDLIARINDILHE